MSEERREEAVVPGIPESLARIADSLEKLTSEPEVEIESGPPICPHCGKLDPVVIVEPDEGGTGEMSQIVIPCRCTECGQPIYIAIDSYSVHQTVETLKTELEMRKAGTA